MRSRRGNVVGLSSERAAPSVRHGARDSFDCVAQHRRTVLAIDHERRRRDRGEPSRKCEVADDRGVIHKGMGDRFKRRAERHLAQLEARWPPRWVARRTRPTRRSRSTRRTRPTMKPPPSQNRPWRIARRAAAARLMPSADLFESRCSSSCGYFADERLTCDYRRDIGRTEPSRPCGALLAGRGAFVASECGLGGGGAPGEVWTTDPKVLKSLPAPRGSVSAPAASPWGQAQTCPRAAGSSACSNKSRTEAAVAPRNKNAPQKRGFSSAPERTRTSTDHSVHKALNLVRAV